MLNILLQAVFFQVININNTSPCFMNFTGGNVWQNCGLGKDYLTGSLLPWNYITGGYFTMILIAIFILITYIKYQKAIFPIIIGSFYLPITYFLFPQQFLVWAVIMAGLVFGFLIWFIVNKQTNE